MKAIFIEKNLEIFFMEILWLQLETIVYKIYFGGNLNIKECGEKCL